MGRKVTVAYEDLARERKASKAASKLVWRRDNVVGLYADGCAGRYRILRQRPNRRHGVYKWGVKLQSKGAAQHEIGSADDIHGAKSLANRHDRLASTSESAASEEAKKSTYVTNIDDLGAHVFKKPRWQLEAQGPEFVKGYDMGFDAGRSKAPRDEKYANTKNDFNRGYMLGYDDAAKARWDLVREGGAEEHRGDRSNYRSAVVKNLRLMGRKDAEAYADRRAVDVDRYEMAGVEPNVAAAILDAADTGFVDFREERTSKESPTRGEWEVIVTNPPRAHRGKILSMAGPGYGYPEGNKIVLNGFYDDEEARHVANSISRLYGAQGAVVTLGPRRKMEAAEDSHPNETLEAAEEVGRLPRVGEKWKNPHTGQIVQITAVIPNADPDKIRYECTSIEPPEWGSPASIMGFHVRKYGWHRVGAAHLTSVNEVAEERRRPGAPPLEDCEHGCPTGECKPFTKLSRDPKAFDACMKRAKEIGELNNSRKMYDLIHHELGSQDREVFGVLCIDFRGQLRDFVILSVGQRHRVAVDIEDILQVVILSGCDGFCVCHSHPSGNAEPSQADRQLTKSIEKAAAVACPNVKMVDHIVCGNRNYFSFADKKLHRI